MAYFAEVVQAAFNSRIEMRSRQARQIVKIRSSEASLRLEGMPA